MISLINIWISISNLAIIRHWNLCAKYYWRQQNCKLPKMIERRPARKKIDSWIVVNPNNVYLGVCWLLVTERVLMYIEAVAIAMSGRSRRMRWVHGKHCVKRWKWRWRRELCSCNTRPFYRTYLKFTGKWKYSEEYTYKEEAIEKKPNKQQ